jgi:hypothetical protein
MIPKVLKLSNILLMFSVCEDSVERATRRFAVFGLLAATVCAGGMDYAGAARAEGPAFTKPALWPAAAEGKTQPLFIIERSKNANVVHYDARLDADGRLDPKEPVVAYWIMLAEDGRRENLNWIEKRKAYGFDIKPAPSGNGYTMTIVAAPDRPITVKEESQIVRAELPIEGQPTVLEKMYINSSEGLTGPKIRYVELRGKDIRTGKERSEKIVPN